jgi:hypothetical protein
VLQLIVPVPGICGLEMSQQTAPYVIGNELMSSTSCSEPASGNEQAHQNLFCVWMNLHEPSFEYRVRAIVPERDWNPTEYLAAVCINRSD